MPDLRTMKKHAATSAKTAEVILSPLELKNPKSKISGDTPVVKESVNFYFPLEKFQPKLEEVA